MVINISSLVAAGVPSAAGYLAWEKGRRSAAWAGRSEAGPRIASGAPPLRPSGPSSIKWGRRGGGKRTDMAKTKAVVLGVGAERGLGAATSRRFAKEGHHVLVAGRTKAKVEK